MLSGRLAAVALERGCKFSHTLWQRDVLNRNCSSIAFDGPLLVSDGYDHRVSMVWFGPNANALQNESESL